MELQTVKRYTLAQINGLEQAAFTGALGRVFEHSPWVAGLTWAKRPFADLGTLHAALCKAVSDSEQWRQLELIRAHPDLVGRAAQSGTLTPESAKEQARAGLGQLSQPEIELFQRFNRSYHKRFGFPFVICARLNKKAAILAGFADRLKNTREQEIATALGEIFKIARLRLEDLVRPGHD
jgi:OHCU decarboxylase